MASGPAPSTRTLLRAAAGALALGAAGLLAARGEWGPAAAIVASGGLAAASARRSAPGPAAAGSEAPSGGARVPVAALYPDSVVLVDRRSVVVDFNREAATVLPGLKLGHPLAFALRDPAVLDAIGAVGASGEPARVEMGARTANDPVHEVRLRRLDSASGQGSGAPAVALFFRDLSPERRLETMRVDFIANVSHELRTPLASLVGFIDTLRGPARDDPASRERFLGIMAAQAARMTRLIDDLLQLSRVELTAHLPPTSPLDLAATVSHMTELMGPLARERGVAIALDLPAGPALVRGNRDEVLRLVENLVENAIKYGGSGGRVSVSVTAGAGGVELAVRDGGPGIAPEHLPRLTERFYRVSTGESRAQGGTGLGLAIVKHIAAHHRARLSIESRPGEGASFRVLFPPAGAGDAGPAAVTELSSTGHRSESAGP